MTAGTKLVFLGLLARIFDLIWIGASISFVYFLYGGLANDGPWAYLSWAFAVGFVARQAAVASKDNKRRIDYVDQLTARGYEQANAEAAWHTATGGGMNLLRNLQQAELGDEIYRLERAVNTPSAKGNST